MGSSTSSEKKDFKAKSKKEQTEELHTAERLTSHATHKKEDSEYLLSLETLVKSSKPFDDKLAELDTPELAVVKQDLKPISKHFKPESYIDVLLVDPGNMLHDQQPLKPDLGSGKPKKVGKDVGWTDGYKKFTSTQFKGFISGAFPDYMNDGTYGFVVAKWKPDEIRVLKFKKGQTWTDPGHTSMLTKSEFGMVKTVSNKKAFIIFAGEFFISGGKLVKWTDGSGHCKPIDIPKGRELFGAYWGLDIKLFKHYNAKSARVGYFDDSYSEYYDDSDYYDQLDYGQYSGQHAVYSDYNGYGYVKMIGNYQSGFADPTIILLLSVMFGFCIIFACIFHVISCAFGYVFGRYNKEICNRNENENKNEYHV